MQILTKVLRWGKQKRSAFTSQAEIDQLLSLNICTFCYTVTLEEIAMMISKIDSDGNAHIDLNGGSSCLPRSNSMGAEEQRNPPFLTKLESSIQPVIVEIELSKTLNRYLITSKLYSLLKLVVVMLNLPNSHILAVGPCEAWDSSCLCLYLYLCNAFPQKMKTKRQK